MPAHKPSKDCRRVSRLRDYRAPNLLKSVAHAAPPAVSAALNAPHERPAPIGAANDPAASFNPASNRSRFITRGRLMRRGTYLNPQELMIAQHAATLVGMQA